MSPKTQDERGKKPSEQSNEKEVMMQVMTAMIKGAQIDEGKRSDRRDRNLLGVINEPRKVASEEQGP